MGTEFQRRAFLTLHLPGSPLSQLWRSLCVALLPVGLAGLMLCVRAAFPSVYGRIIQEDSLLEDLQAVLYLVACGVFLFVSLSETRAGDRRAGILLALIGLAPLLVTLEEVSWGQRCFAISPPDFFLQHNVQHEISLHNLSVFQKGLHWLYVAVGVYGTFGWTVVKKGRGRTRSSWKLLVDASTPPRCAALYFFPVALMYLLLECVFPPGPDGLGVLVWRDQEPAELLLALGVLVHASDLYLRRCRHALPRSSYEHYRARLVSARC